MKPEYIRNRNLIIDLIGDDHSRLKSINQAKRKSWHLQMKHDNALGRGTVKISND